MSKKPIFSLDDFKKWMHEQKDELHAEKDEVVGSEVQPKINTKRLMTKMEVEEGDDEELSEEFAKDGGKVLEAIDKKYLIEVNSGSFYLHSKYVEPKD